MSAPRYTDLVIVMLLAVVGLALPFAPPSIGGLRPLFALLTVFLLPGYAILAAAFPSESFDFPEHLIMLIIVSVAVAVGGGLLLNLTPWGIQLDSWSGLLFCVTVGATFVALVRRGPQRATRGAKLNLTPKFGQIVLMAHALLIIGVALAVGFKPATKAGFQGYSLLWLVPGEGDQQTTLRVGVRSMEFAPAQYRLVLRADERVAQEWPLIELTPKKQWETFVTLPADLLDSSDVQAELYRLDQPETVYRHVVLRSVEIIR